MRLELPSPWPSTEADAIALQGALRAQVLTTSDPDAVPPRRIAGLDIAYDTESDLIAAAVVVLDAETLETVAEAIAVDTVTFPYVPGLLAFREIPALVAALNLLTVDPDLLVCDGYGLAHPRGAHRGATVDLVDADAPRGQRDGAGHQGCPGRPGAGL